MGRTEQARHQRYDACFLLYYAGKKIFGYSYLRNISKGGCFVEIADPVDTGASFDVEIFLDLGTRALPMRSQAEVVWNNRDSKVAKVGMGLQFGEMTATDGENLQKALDTVSSVQLPIPAPPA